MTVPEPIGALGMTSTVAVGAPNLTLGDLCFDQRPTHVPVQKFRYPVLLVLDVVELQHHRI